MMCFISALTYTEFKYSVNIQFDNILYGFDNYINSNLSSSSSNSINKDTDFINFICALFDLNNNELIIDFFINKLSTEEINNLRKLLMPEDKLTLDSLLKTINTNTSYFKIKDKSLIPFFTRLSTHEVFFCTMYFVNIPVTIWGNYNYSFPCFFDSHNTLNKLKKIANDYNLKL